MCKKCKSVSRAMLIVGLMAMCTVASPQHPRIEKPYKPTWESLKQHSDPKWFDDAKFGIYLHWGVYSVPAYGNEWYPHWMYEDKEHPRRGNYYRYHKEHFSDPAEFGYKDFIPMFKAEKFDPDRWAELFEKAGAKFAGPVAEHHDGFAMWDSALTKWDAADMGPKRDIVGELAEAIRKRGMKFMTSFHHARKWWYYEYSYTPDRKYDTEDARYAGAYGLYPPVHEKEAAPTREYMEAWKAKLLEVIDKYQPDLIWFDGGLREKFFRSSIGQFQQYKKEFMAYYYNKAEEWAKEVAVTYKHQDFPRGTAILDIERGRMGKLTEYKWLTDTSVDKRSWCYIKNPEYKSVNTLVDVLVDIVSKNGNLLLNVGPRPDGVIPAPARERLLGIGEWLKVNGEAIYGTRPWIIYGEGPAKTEGEIFKERQEHSYTAEDIRFTRKGNNLYAIVLDWPEEGELTIKSLNARTKLSTEGISSIGLLGSDSDLEWSRNEQGLTIKLPEARPCKYAFVFKINLKGEMILSP